MKARLQSINSLKQKKKAASGKDIEELDSSNKIPINTVRTDNNVISNEVRVTYIPNKSGIKRVECNIGNSNQLFTLNNNNEKLTQNSDINNNMKNNSQFDIKENPNNNFIIFKATTQNKPSTEEKKKNPDPNLNHTKEPLLLNYKLKPYERSGVKDVKETKEYSQ